jgi:hypothetical protein
MTATAAPGIVTGGSPPNATVQIQPGMNVQPVVLVDQNGNYITSSGGTAVALATTSTPVNVSGAVAPTAGQALTGTSGTTATWQTSPNIVPVDHGLLAWTHDIDSNPNGVQLIAGSVYLNKIPIRSPLTATYLWFSATAAGTGTSNGSFVGLYNSGGTLLTSSSDLGGAIFAGNHQGTLTTPQSLTTGFVWAGIVTNQSSAQPFLRSPFTYTSAASPNLNLTAANFRIALPASPGGTQQTSLPASFTPSALTNTGAAQLWFGIA